MRTNSVRSVVPRGVRDMLENVIVVVHLLVALGVVGLVLVQQGKGADAGASFGSGASATVFGSQGSATFLSRLTAVLATIFFVTSLGLGFYAKQKADMIGAAGLPDPAVLEIQGKPAAEDVPAVGAQKPAASDVPVAEGQKQ